MSHTDYEYAGLMAETWDLFRGDTSQWSDRFFFREIVRQSGQPALDVGCGTGRILLDFMAEGVDIDGVDNSPEMLALCSAKAEALGLAPALHEQQAQELDLPRRYRTIIVPSSSFQLLTDPADAARAMARFRDHLLPGGALAMPFMELWRPGEPAEQAEWRLTGERERPDGALARRWSRWRFDPAAELEHTEDRYELRRGDEIIAAEERRRSPATRSYGQAQARRLYEAAGFREIRLLGGFTQEPAGPDDRTFCAVGVR